jgi:5-formyltetrahydrofolate cyclo-ligase
VNTKQTLRKELLAARRAVPRLARAAAALSVARLVASTRWLAPGKRIGIYASMLQELGTAPLIALAQARGRRLRFVPLSTRGRIHPLGMHEPSGTDHVPARFLDTIFVPAVALDARGARLGHGAGFYDRTLAFRRLRRHWRGPRLVALAYSFQVVPRVPVEATDVFMDVIVTDRGINELLAHEDRTLDVRHR